MGDYVCNQCNKEFSRKWNVLRHNEQIHHGLAIIYDKTTGFTIRNSIEENDLPLINSFVEDLNIDKICGKLFQPLTELEKVLADMPELERIKYISNLIVAALNDSDPVELIQYTLDFERSARSKQKIVSYLVKGNNMNNVQAEHLLKDTIRSSKYFKKYTKLDHTKLKSI